VEVMTVLHRVGDEGASFSAMLAVLVPHNLRWLDGLVLAHPAHSAEELRITIDWCVEGGHPVLTLSRQQDAARLILRDVDIGFSLYWPKVAVTSCCAPVAIGRFEPMFTRWSSAVCRYVGPAPGELCLG
jgi:hypothetical protein